MMKTVDNLKMAKEKDLYRAIIDENVSFAKRLLRARANPNMILPDEGISPFHLAMGPDLDEAFPRLLVKYGGDPNVRSVEGLTPLHIAVTWGMLDVMQLLLFTGGDPYLIDQDGNTAFDLARQYGHTECSAYLESYCTICGCPEETGTPKYTYTIKRQSPALPVPRQTTPVYGNTPQQMQHCSKRLDSYLTDCVKNQPRRSTILTQLVQKQMYQMTNQRKRFVYDVTSPGHPYLEERGNNSNHSSRSNTPVDNSYGSLSETESVLQDIEHKSISGNASERYDKTLPWRPDNHSPNSSSDESFQTCDEGEREESVIEEKSKPVQETPTNHVAPGVDWEKTLVQNLSKVSVKSPQDQRNYLDSDTYDFSLLSVRSELNQGFISKRSSIESSLSEASTIEYIYSDPEERITLIEKRIIPSKGGSTGRSSIDSAHSVISISSGVSDDTVIYDWKSYDLLANHGAGKGSHDSIPNEVQTLTNEQLRASLVELGDDPGPVLNTTRQSYLLRLVRLKQDPKTGRLQLTNQAPDYPPELTSALEGNFDQSTIADQETKMVAMFQNPDRNRKWREGALKSSFNYLLLDPRVTSNLPLRCGILGEKESFKIFVSAIFYIGKGKRARPYAHLYEAISQMQHPKQKPINKVKHILDIWNEGHGVVSLHCFQNVIPVEAYTREACMVDAIGLGRLTNIKRGDYYGVATTWFARDKRKVGVHLLKKALQIFMGEGERQISPPDIDDKCQFWTPPRTM